MWSPLTGGVPPGNLSRRVSIRLHICADSGDVFTRIGAFWFGFITAT